MSYCVKNPGLMPGFESLKNGDIGRKKKMLKEVRSVSVLFRPLFSMPSPFAHLTPSRTSPNFLLDYEGMLASLVLP